MTDQTTDDVRPARIEGSDVHSVSDGLVFYRKDDDSVHHLNAMATLFYELADGRPLSSIAASFGAIFELDADEAARITRIAYDELVASRLVS